MIFSLVPKEEINLMVVPENTFVESIHGYGRYRLEAIYQLGELEGRKDGELLTGTLQEVLGAPIDGYIFMQEPIDGQSPAKWGQSLIKKIVCREKSTNLIWWDWLRVCWQTRKIRQDKIKIIHLEQTGVLKEVTLSDESKTLEIDAEKIDEISGNFFKDPQIRLENLAVAVLNGTDHPGLASKGARLITNIGGRVIKVGDAEQKTSQCKIKVQSSLRKPKNYTARKLQKIFNCQLEEEDLTDYRVDILLLLGEEYWEKLTKRTPRS